MQNVLWTSTNETKTWKFRFFMDRIRCWLCFHLTVCVMIIISGFVREAS